MAVVDCDERHAKGLEASPIQQHLGESGPNSANNAQTFDITYFSCEEASNKNTKTHVQRFWETSPKKKSQTNDCAEVRFSTHFRVSPRPTA